MRTYENAIDDDTNSRVDDCNGWDFAQDNDPMPDSAREYHGSHDCARRCGGGSVMAIKILLSGHQR